MGGFCESLAVFPYLFDQRVLLKYVAGMEFSIGAEKLIVFVAISPEEDAQACRQQRKTWIRAAATRHGKDESGVREVYVAVNPEGNAPSWGIYHDQCYIWCPSPRGVMWLLIWNCCQHLMNEIQTLFSHWACCRCKEVAWFGLHVYASVCLWDKQVSQGAMFDCLWRGPRNCESSCFTGIWVVSEASHQRFWNWVKVYKQYMCHLFVI